MNVIGEVKVWRLPAGKFNQVLQNPGMDLGKPDRIDRPESELKIRPAIGSEVSGGYVARSHKGRPTGRGSR